MDGDGGNDHGWAKWQDTWENRWWLAAGLRSWVVGPGARRSPARKTQQRPSQGAELSSCALRTQWAKLLLALG